MRMCSEDMTDKNVADLLIKMSKGGDFRDGMEETREGRAILFLFDWMQMLTLRDGQPRISCGIGMFARAVVYLLHNEAGLVHVANNSTKEMIEATDRLVATLRSKEVRAMARALGADVLDTEA